MSSSVLDASAVLAYVQGEPGAARVSEALAGGAILSVVNLAEVVTKLAGDGLSERAIHSAIDVLEVEMAAFDEADAISAGLLRTATRPFGLSLGDRACVALALRSGLPALTGDRAWREVGPALGVEIEVIR